MSSLEAARRAQAAQLQIPLTSQDEPDRDYTKVHNAVSQCPLLSDGAFRTYVNIKSHYRGHGSSFPGLERLACYQGCTRRTIQTNIAELKAAGLIDVTQRGLGLTNVYDIVDARAWTPDALAAYRQRAPRRRSGSLLHISNGVEAGFTSRVEADFTSRCEASFPQRRHSNKKTQSEEDAGKEEESLTVCAASAAPRARPATVPAPKTQGRRADDTVSAPVQPRAASEDGSQRRQPAAQAPPGGSNGHVPPKAEGPRRARAGLQMVSTADDTQAPRARRLALKLAGDVLGCRVVNVERLARYEAFAADLLAQGWTARDLSRWMDWMASGTHYWAGKSRMWDEGRMVADLADWDGAGRPAEKEDDGGPG